MSNLPRGWIYLPFAMLAVIFLFCLHSIHYPTTTMLKPLPIYGLMLVVLVTPTPIMPKALLLCALFLSSIGDIALTLPVPLQIEAGLFAFLIAHSLYIFLFIMIRRQQNFATRLPVYRQGLAILTVLFMVIFFAYLRPFLGDKLMPVATYISVITAMVVLALRTSVICAVGAILFLLSDSIIAIDEFISKPANHFFWIMLTYYLAQWLLVVGFLKIMDSKDDPLVQASS